MRDYKYSTARRPCKSCHGTLCRMMAQHVDRSGTPAALLLFVFTIFNLVYGNTFATVTVSNNSSVKSVKVLPAKEFYAREDPSSASTDFLVEVLGTGLENNVSLYWSPTSSDCDPENKLNAIWIEPGGDRAIYKFAYVPNFKVTKIYFCRRVVSRFGETWTNLGKDFTIVNPHLRSE